MNFTNYLSPGLSPEELKEVEKLKELREWRKASPKNEEEFLKMRETWRSDINTEKYQSDKEEDYIRFLIRSAKSRKRQKLLQFAWRSAAAVALLFATAYTAFQIGSKPAIISLAETHIKASWGSQVETTLPDGTMVWLNAGSELTYSQTFGINDRAVNLIGEGYFEVTHNKSLPFSVQTGELKVNVHGTKFNVRNYADDREAIVSLLEGKVSIVNNVQQSKAIAMAPNQKLMLDKEAGDTRLKKVVAERTIGWTNGYLFFDEELLSDIAKDLERSYDVSITVHPSVANRRFDGEFIRKETSITHIMDFLASAGNIE
jgi:ferric-dicitrate binding protein FerR (iron transport regulator)